jgi:8-oxo-dGTP diphosphatase
MCCRDEIIYLVLFLIYWEGIVTEQHRVNHILAVSGLVRNTAGDVLMILSPLRGWEMPGGQVEEGEQLQDGLIREIREETGVIATVGQHVGTYINVKHPPKMIFSFLCDYVSGDLTTSDESLEVVWVNPADALARVTHPAIHDRMRDLLNFNGQRIFRTYTTDPYQVLTEEPL